MTHFLSTPHAVNASRPSAKRLLGTCTLAIAALSLLGSCSQATANQPGSRTLSSDAALTRPASDTDNLDELEPSNRSTTEPATTDIHYVVDNVVTPGIIEQGEHVEDPRYGDPVTPREYGVRSLTPTELEEYGDHTTSLFREHSFNLDYPDAGNADFVAFSYESGSIRNLGLSVHFENGQRTVLPQHEEGRMLVDLKAVSFQRTSSDGAVPDIVVIADYITGIGPSGTDPFPVTVVYNYVGNGQYEKDELFSNFLTNLGIATVADAMAIINTTAIGAPGTDPIEAPPIAIE